MKRMFLMVVCALGECAFATGFEVSATNALTRRSNLVSAGFTNYMCQCANQTTNVELSLSAHIILGISQLEMFDMTMDEANLDAAFQSVSNALSFSALTTNQWQYWHMAILHISCMNTANNKQGAYLVASNAWAAIQDSGFEDSTNIGARALLSYYGVGTDTTIKAAIALNKALSADAVNKKAEITALKVFLPDRLKQEMERFLSDE